MNSINRKSIIIEGDKSQFSTKAAIDRLKRDLREDNKKKLSINDYFKEGWTYNIVSNTDTEMKIQLVNQVKEPSIVVENDEKRKILKEKLKMMRTNKIPLSQMKQNLKNKVPSDVLDVYLQLKKTHIKIQIPPPDVVLSKPDEYKNVVYTMIQSFGMFKGKNNLIVNYYRLLAKHLDISPTFVPQQSIQPNEQPNKQSNEPTSDFIEMLRKQREENVDNDVDDEMKEIYQSLGINLTDENELDETMSENYKSKENNETTSEHYKSKENTNNEVDNEMKKIYQSLGINSNDENELDKTINENYKSGEIDNEMNEIYKSLGNQIKDSTLEV